MTKRGQSQLKAVDDAPDPRPSVTATLQMCVEAIPALTAIAHLQLAPQQAYHIAKLARLIEAEAKHYNTESNKLVKEMGDDKEPTEEDKAKGITETYQQVPPEKMKEYREKLEAIGEVQVVIEWGPIRLAWLADQKVTALNMMQLGPFIVEE